MTARSIRRAVERKQKKLARKAEQRNSPVAPAAPISAARLAANQANAQLSASPISETGKAKSSLNPASTQGDLQPVARVSTRTGLTGRTVLLSSEDAAEYERHLAAFRDEYSPVGLRECELVQSIADTFWRVARIPCLEMAIFAKGRIEFANLFDEHELAARPHLMDAHTFLVYEKQIRNLQLQEARLVRRRERETTELRKLQDDRIQNAELTEKEGLCQAPPANGFEFSTAEFHARPFPAPLASAIQQPISGAATAPIIAHQAA